MSRLRADLLLLVAALIWGTAFVAQKYANETMGPVTFCGVRFMLSTLALAPLALWETRRQTESLKARDLLLAGLIGLCLFAAISMQQIALVTTTATNAGFLTTIYIAFVPFVVWLVQRVPPRPIVLLACGVALAGAWLLTGNSEAKAWSRGDMIVLASDIIWAFQITLVSKFLAHAPRPFFFTFMQYGVTGILGTVAGMSFEPVILSGIRAALPAILYAGLLSGGLAYTLQIIGQRYTPPSEASLILSLEGVFAALAAALILNERLTFLASVGCVLILIGIVMAEIGPLWKRGKAIGSK